MCPRRRPPILRTDPPPPVEPLRSLPRVEDVVHSYELHDDLDLNHRDPLGPPDEWY